MAERKRPAALSAVREATHGWWPETAAIAAELNAVIDAALLRRRQRRPLPLPAAQLEALHQIAFKIARILAGDPGHPDHWDDIAGYAWLGGTVRQHREGRR